MGREITHKPGQRRNRVSNSQGEGKPDLCHLIHPLAQQILLFLLIQEKISWTAPAVHLLLGAVSPPVLPPLTPKPLPGSLGSFCRKCQSGEMQIQNGQERIPSPPNSCFLLLQGEGRALQASCEPRTSPRQIPSMHQENTFLQTLKNSQGSRKKESQNMF